jgi:acetyltransferase-like isoleucine patch superfamily enzyme
MGKVLAELRLYVCNNWVSHMPSHRIRLLFYRRVMGFKIGKNSYIHMGCSFDAARGLEIGNDSVINAKCRLDTRENIKIGNNVSISNEVIILTADHDMDSPHFTGRNFPITIADYVWIGTRAMLLPGVTLGIGSVVAAGAVVTKSVDSYKVVGGIPARIIKERLCRELEYTVTYRRLFQ